MDTELKQELIKAARSMGYRKMDTHKEDSLWGKPLGTTLITLDIEKVELTQWFYSGLQKIEVWSRDIYNPEGYGGSNDPRIRERLTNWIKYFEDWHIHANGFSLPVTYDFSFLSLEEELDL